MLLILLCWVDHWNWNSWDRRSGTCHSLISLIIRRLLVGLIQSYTLWLFKRIDPKIIKANVESIAHNAQDLMDRLEFLSKMGGLCTNEEWDHFCPNNAERAKIRTLSMG